MNLEVVNLSNQISSLSFSTYDQPMNQDAARPIDSLIRFLSEEKARGRKHVYLDESARSGLRALLKRAKNPKPKMEIYEVPAAKTLAQALTISGETKEEQLDRLKLQAENWQPARQMQTLRETMVFSHGNPHADLFFVGEAPGYYEEREKKIFVGELGEKFDQILKAMGLNREQIYLTSAVKFRPSLAKQSTNNRRPSREEILCCKPLLEAEISIVKPKIIIALGDSATESLTDAAASFEAMRGTWSMVGETPLRVSLHPGILLHRGSTNETKRLLWEDMLAVMERLQMPISEKQKKFFLSNK